MQPSLFQNPPQPRADVTARKHKGNAESIAANPARGKKEKDMSTILAFISFRGTSYLKEIVAETGIPIQSASGRIADLKAAGKVYCTGDRKEGCGVLKAK